SSLSVTCITGLRRRRWHPPFRRRRPIGLCAAARTDGRWSVTGWNEPMKTLITALALAALIATTQSAAAAPGDRRDIGQPGPAYERTPQGYPSRYGSRTGGEKRQSRPPARRRGFGGSRSEAAGSRAGRTTSKTLEHEMRPRKRS